MASDGGARVLHDGARRARLVDVAQEAGVTKSVASRVLNEDPTLVVRPDTRAKVWTAAQDLDYRPHAGAQALARHETRAIALLVPDLSNPVYSRIIRGAYQRAREHGYVLLIAEDTPELVADGSFAELVETGRVDGLLIASSRPAHPLLSSPRLASIPHVFANREVPGSGRNVRMDLESASAAAVRHLYALGHRRIGHIAGPEDLQPARARELGFVREMMALGLHSAPTEHGPFSEAGGAEATRQLLQRWPEVTALYASTLSQTIGVMHAARNLGRRIPTDLSVISYDDLPLAEYVDPPLTTIAMPLTELGAAAIDSLTAQLAGQAPQDVLIATPPSVIVRKSTSAIRTQTNAR